MVSKRVKVSGLLACATVRRVDVGEKGEAEFSGNGNKIQMVRDVERMVTTGLVKSFADKRGESGGQSVEEVLWEFSNQPGEC